jgi:hypothetical protein
VQQRQRSALLGALGLGAQGVERDHRLLAGECGVDERGPVGVEPGHVPDPLREPLRRFEDGVEAVVGEQFGGAVAEHAGMPAPGRRRLITSREWPREHPFLGPRDADRRGRLHPRHPYS